jgi:hypothetical protein
MEQGRFPDWQSETSSPESGESKPETSGKKKKHKKGSERLASLAALNAGGEKDHKPNDKLRRALTDFLVEREPSTGAGKSERKKKSSADASSAEPRERLTQGSNDESTAERKDEHIAASEYVTESHEYDHVKAEAEADAKESPASEDSKKMDEEKWSGYELPLNAIGGEVILQLQGETPVSERIILNKPESEPVPESETEEPKAAVTGQPTETPLVYRAQAEGPQQVSDFETPHGDAQEQEPVAATVVPPIENAPVFELPPEPLEEALDPVRVRMLDDAASRRLEPAEAYRMYMEREAADRPGPVSSSEDMISRRYAEDAEYYAAKNAQRSALFTGLFVGALVEHIRHKRRERKAEKRFKTQGRQLQQVRQDQHFFLEGQAKQQAENQRKLVSAESQLANTEKRLEDRARFERRPKSERQTRPNAQQNDAEALQRLTVPAEHRLETSAWHTIEVDSRTGKPVERPAFTYGHEYYQERAHEGAPAARRNAAAGELAITGASTSVGQAQSDSGPAADDYSPSASNIPNATRQGPPPSNRKLKNADSRKSLSNTGPIWPYVIALVVIFICLIYLA